MFFADGKYAESVDSFVKSQQQNDGFYFAEAHTWEGKARIAFANATDDQQSKDKIQQDHVSKFEKDAAEAAPAFYDLGVALQACGQYEKAIKAYDDFLRWYDKSARPFRWEDSKIPKRNPVIITEEAPYYYEHGKREREQSNSATASYTDNWRYWVVDESNIYYVSGDQLVCRDIENGTEAWRTSLGDMQRVDGNSYDPVYANYLVKRGPKVYFSSLMNVLVIDALTGKVETEIKTGVPARRVGRFYVFDEEGVMLIHNSLKRNRRDKAGGELVAYSVETGELIWSKQQEFSFVNSYHNGSFFTTNESGTQLFEIDVRTGREKRKTEFLKPVYQVWPGEDHLLIRTTDTPRFHTNDKYYNYIYDTEEVIDDSRKLFFSRFYNSLPEKAEQLSIPMMDKNEPKYRLLPALTFFPRSSVPIMDKYGKNYIFIARYNLPWFRLDGDTLFGWTRDRTIRGYSLDKNELLWNKFIKDSTSGIDIAKHFIITRADRHWLRVYSTLASPNVERCVSSFVNKGICLESVNRLNEAINVVGYGLKNSPDDVDANITLARLHMKMGNMNEALEYYAATLRYSSLGSLKYQEARNVLQGHIGLLKILPYNEARYITQNEQKVYFSYKLKGTPVIACYDIETGQLNPEFIRDYASWRLHNNYIIYTDSDNNCYSIYLADNCRKLLFTVDPLEEGETIVKSVWDGTDGAFNLLENLVIHVVAYEQELGGAVVAHNINTGEKMWEFPFEGAISLSLNDGFLIAGLYHTKDRDSKNCMVIRLDPVNGEVMWLKALKQFHPNACGRIKWHKGIFTFKSGEDLVVSFCYRSYGDYWGNPRVPFYGLDPDSGSVRDIKYGQEENMSISAYNGPLTIAQRTWSFGHTYEQGIVSETQWRQECKYDIVKADFHEQHPKVLAKFEPLRHLKNEFDLTKHIEALNKIINDPIKRKAFIDKYKTAFLKRGLKKNPKAQFTIMGYEPLQNTLRILLERGGLNEDEEKFAARQLMSLWKDREPNVDIRAYRYPSGCRFEDVRACDITYSGHEIALGHHRGCMMAACLDLDSQYVTKWTQMPQLNYYKVYDDGIEDICQKGDYTIVRSVSGIYIYNVKTLLEYMATNVTTEHGCFSVDCNAENVKRAVDGNPETYATFKGDERAVFGVDNGVRTKVNCVRITPLEGSGKLLKGAFIQASKFSETGKFRNVTQITDELKDEESNIIKFDEEYNGRYYRIVTRNGEPVKIAGIEFCLRQSNE